MSGPSSARPLVHIVTELKDAVAELRENVIAATVSEQEDWRYESFVDAMRNYRHITQLIGDLEQLSVEAGGAS